MTLPIDSKFSLFTDGGDLIAGDTVVGLRGGINTKFNNTGGVGTFLPLLGGTMLGVINMGGFKITDLDTPTDPADAVTKLYVDSTFAHLGANSDITSMTGLTGTLRAPTGVVDANGNLLMQWTGAASAVNYWRFYNSAAAAALIVAAEGTDSSVAVTLGPKNADVWIQDPTNTLNSALRWYNAAGTHYVGFKAPTLTGNQIWALPAADGSAGQFIKTDGAGNLAFSSAAPVATLIATTATTTNAEFYPVFVASSSSGNQAPDITSGIHFNPSTNTITATTFVGALTGNASTASAVALGGITGLGTGIATALAINVGSAGAPVLFNGAGGTPSSMVGTNITGTAAGLTAGTASAVPVGGITGLGTGVATALAINIGSAGAPVLFNGAGGTPSSMTGTNITGTAAGLTAGTASAVAVGGITGLGTGVATALAANVNGSGAIALTTSPTFVTPVLGAATATSINFGGSTLSAYATGSWTPIDGSGASLSFTLATGSYIKIGNLVWASCQVTYPSTANASQAIIGGLPFATGSTLEKQGGNVCYTTSATMQHILTTASNTIFTLFTAAGGSVTNATMSGVASYFQIVYSI